MNSDKEIMNQLKNDQIKKQIKKRIAKEKKKASQKEYNLTPGCDTRNRMHYFITYLIRIR